MSNADVAAKLFISQETVKSHVRHILTKLEADTRTHAVAIALREANRSTSLTRMASNRRRFERRADERERMLLADRLITAEQEERRRLALELHDGPVQNLSGIALMLDSVGAAIEQGRLEDATRVLEHRARAPAEHDPLAPRPLVQPRAGHSCATRASARPSTPSPTSSAPNHDMIELSLDSADDLAEPAQVAFYQIVREAVNQALARQSTSVSIAIARRPDGGADAIVEDDGAGERRKASVQVRSSGRATLGGDVVSKPRGRGGGMSVRVSCPPKPSGARIPAPPWRRRVPRSSSRSRRATSSASGKASRRPWAPTLEEDDDRKRVIKVAPSPLPGDSRRCAYVFPE